MAKRIHKFLASSRIAIIAIAVAVLACAASYAFELPDGVATCPPGVEVHRTADRNGDVFWKLKAGDHVKVKAINGEFYKVMLPNQKEGYAHNSCLDVSVWAKIINTGAWIYDQPMPTAKVTGDLRNLSDVRIINKWQNWYEVVLNDRRTHGWVEQSSLQAPVEFFSAWLMFRHETPFAPPAVADNKAAPYQSRYISETQNAGVSPYAMPAMPENVDPASLRFKVVDYAKQFLGVPYVYGGSTPSGFDCSGFTQYVYAHFGIKVDRSPGPQSKQGEYVSPDQLQPGDLVLFGSANRVFHSALYIGDGKIIHAEGGGRNGNVKITPLFTGWYSSRIYMTRRIIRD